MANNIPIDIHQYIATHTTLTLATVSGQHPWATSLFYVADTSLRLYFISATGTRHVMQAAQNPQAAVTITEHDQQWQDIQGVQLTGSLARIDDAERPRVETMYKQKFPFIRALLQETTKAADPVLRERFLQSCFYAITPAFIRFVDNRRGFGFKQEFSINN